MKSNKEYIYSFPNASCTLRVIEHLRDNHQLYLHSVAVINLIDRWIVKISQKDSVPSRLSKNLQAFLNEMGVICDPPIKIINALAKLEAGESAINIMNRDRVVIVVYGKPETEEIEIFRDQIVDRLGYCPQNMT